MATLAPAGKAQAQGAAKGLSVPIAGTFGTGGKFAGTFNIQRFAVQDNKIVAVGLLTGTATDAAGNVVATGGKTVALPVTLSSGPAAAAAADARPENGEVRFVKTSYAPGAPKAAAAQGGGCGILHLELGPLDLDLLGLQVHLNRVVLDITAQPGPGNLLGNLLCAIAGLLDPQGPLTQIVNLLNQLLGILNSL